VVDTAFVTDGMTVAAPAPLTGALVVIEAVTTEAATAAAGPPPAPSDDLVPPTPTAPAPTPGEQPRSPIGAMPAVEADATASSAPAPADQPDLAALQAEQARAAAQMPAAVPTAAPAAPAAALVAPPRPAKPAVDLSTSAEAAPAEDGPAAASAAPVEAPAAPVDTPRTRDVIDRAQTIRADARSGAAADPDASPASDGPEAAAPAATASTSTASAPPPAVLPVPLVLAGADEGVSAPLAAAAQPTEARPAETGVSQALSTLSRATIETTAQLAAQIVRKLEGRSTRFEMALTPEGLGQVDVSLDIDADGKLIARMAFDNPLAATELRGRADELRRQLQDAGFTVADDALSFAERDASAGQQGGSAFDRRPDPRSARAFGAASRLEADADRLLTPGRWIPLTLTPDRVDMKV
jgi:flagellar hook-length control protein FliK